MDKIIFVCGTDKRQMILSKCGIEKRLNYNVGDNKSRVQMSAEKEKAIMEAFRHFNMI